MPTDLKGAPPSAPKENTVSVPIKELTTGTRANAFNECGAAITTDSMERFLLAFERSARRWEMIVYPAMFAFMLLAGYGFYLIYSLTNDMRVIAQNLDPNMGLHMSRLSTDMEKMTSTIAHMSDNVREMAGTMGTMAQTTTSMAADTSTMSQRMNYLTMMESIANQMVTMNQGIHGMNVNMDMMRQDVASMRNAVRPMSMFGNIMPFF
ncbi:MAG: hypothetical protein ACFCUJ_02255 [Thiotrichales bacterium]